MKTNFIFFLLIILTLTGYSQTFEEFKKKREKEQQKMKQEEADSLQSLDEQYAKYIEEQDRKFSAYLEKEWKAFELYKANRLKPEPKPLKTPRFDPDEIKTKDKDPKKIEEKKSELKEESPDTTQKSKPQKRADLPVKKLIPEQMQVVAPPDKNPEAIKPVVKPLPPEESDQPQENINFYGKKLSFPVDEQLKQFRCSSVSQNVLSDAWKSLADKNISQTVQKAADYKEKMKLNDWAYLMMIEQFAEEVFPVANEQKIFSWFLMNKSGYDIRIAYAGQELSLLIPAKTQLYNTRYLLLDDKKYFIRTALQSDQIYTYDAAYPPASNDVDLHIYTPVKLGEELQDKTIAFKHQNKTYEIPITYNQAHIDFYQDYPNTEVDVFLNAPVSDALQNSLKNGLQDKVDEMEDTEAVNFLLALAQKSFDYKTDQEQFGKEKFFFPEEVFHFPYSDCEDRSALFTWLIRNLKGLDIIGLDYPGHLATAVKLDGAEGAFVSVASANYVVADPTYVNAPYGVVMPEFKDAPVKVIQFMTALLNRANFYGNYAFVGE
ncbi:MAG: hypothetical protein ACQESX_12105 [Bacteroidota bacterium]